MDQPSPRSGVRHFFAPGLRFPSPAQQFLEIGSAVIFWGSLSAPLGLLLVYLGQVLSHWFRE